MRTITIRLEVPDDVNVVVDQGETPRPRLVEPEFPPLSGAGRPAPKCPTHNDSHYVQAGVSKTSGRSYKAFWGCTERSCNWRENA